MWGEERNWIEVSLHGASFSEDLPSFGQWNAPIESDNVCPGLPHGREQRRSIDPKVDDRNAECLNSSDKFRRGGKAIFAVVGNPKGPGPAIEDLDNIGSGLNLLRGVANQNLDQLSPALRAASSQYCLLQPDP